MNINIYIYIYISLYVCMCVLWHGVTLIPWPPQEPIPLRFPVWLGIPKPMIPYPLLWEEAVRTVGSHLGRIPNCSEVPDTPPPPTGTPGTAPPPPPPGTALPGAPARPPPPSPPSPPGAFGQQLVGGVVGVQNRGVAPPPPCTQLSSHGPILDCQAVPGLARVNGRPLFPMQSGLALAALHHGVQHAT